MLKRFVTAVVLAVACAAGGFAQSRGGRRHKPPAQAEAAVINIIQIDFMNYTFQLAGRAYKLIDGFYAEMVAPDGQWVVFESWRSGKIIATSSAAERMSAQAQTDCELLGDAELAQLVSRRDAAAVRHPRRFGPRPDRGSSAR